MYLLVAYIFPKQMIVLVFFPIFADKKEYGACVLKSSAFPYIANDSEESIRIRVEDAGLTSSDGDTLPQGNVFITEKFNVTNSIVVSLNKLTHF